MLNDLVTLITEYLSWGLVFSKAGQLVLILGVAFAVYYYRNKLVDRLVRRLIGHDARISELAASKRRDTLMDILTGTLGTLVVILAVMMSLQVMGIAIGPILAAAGVAGIAIGFGGQYLIRDLISGLFIIVENQYRVGDIVKFGDIAGQVEDISMRMTTLRDLDGVVHHIPHGEIKGTSNLTKYFSRINLDIGIAYDTDLEHAIKVIDEVGAELAEDPDWKDVIKKQPHFLRVDDFADSAIIVKILGETEPSQQWSVAGELRKRLKVAFDREGIVIPFPQRVIHNGK